MSKAIVLSKEDRDRFAMYLEQTADASEGIAIQMERLPDPMMHVMSKKYKGEAVACRIVARMLSCTEDG